MSKYSSFPTTTTIIIIALLIIFSLKITQSANILFYFGVGTYSHRIAVWPLVELLANSGHSVTYLSASHPKKIHANPKVTEYVPVSLAEFMDRARGSKSNVIKRRLEGTSLSLWLEVEELGAATCEALMGDPDYVNFVHQTKFDLLVIDGLFNDCALGIVHEHKSQYILFDTTHPFPWQFDIFGFPPDTSSISDLALAFPQPLDWVGRILSSLSPLFWQFRRQFFIYPRIQNAINQGLALNGEGKINLRKIEKKVSLVLVNSHFTLDYPRSMPPLFVSVGGLHLAKQRKAEEVPADIQKFIDESGDAGFIYISFGSAAQISKVEPELQKKFFYALGNSSVKFLWKWESDLVPKEMPSNVLTAKWMPQAEILANPKIRGFMTHGGLLSIIEATVSKIPLILLPIFAEQHYNARRAEEVGYGIFLEVVGIEQAQIEEAIQKILTDSKYKEKMQQVATMFQERQNPPLDTAVWWVEYILRHKSNDLLIPGSIHQSWYVTRLLDVWGIVFGPLLILVGFAVGFLVKTKFGSKFTPKIIQKVKKR